MEAACARATKCRAWQQTEIRKQKAGSAVRKRWYSTARSMPADCPPTPPHTPDQALPVLMLQQRSHIEEEVLPRQGPWCRGWEGGAPLVGAHCVEGGSDLLGRRWKGGSACVRVGMGVAELLSGQKARAEQSAWVLVEGYGPCAITLTLFSGYRWRCPPTDIPSSAQAAGGPTAGQPMLP
jgi:hypothetical protein